MENRIDLAKCPHEPFITMYAPDGTEIVRTNAELTFNWVRLQIKNIGVDGYYLVTEDGDRVDIDRDGLLVYPQGFSVDKPKLPGDVGGSVSLELYERF